MVPDPKDVAILLRNWPQFALCSDKLQQSQARGWPDSGAQGAAKKGISVLKSRVVYGAFFSLALMVGPASTAHAFTLGDLRGSVIVGRALDLSVTVQAGPDEEVSTSCFSAEVFHADTLQPKARVTVSPQPSKSTPTFKVRIQSPALVDEPVVTVQLHSTCAASFTRRYVVLADFPVVVMPSAQPVASLPVVSAVAPAPSAPAPAVTVAPPVAVPVAGLTDVTGVAKTPVAAPAVPVTKALAKPKHWVVRKKPRVAVHKAAGKSAVPTPPVAQPEPAKPALKLEALNLPAGQVDGLANAAAALPSAESVLQAKQLETLQEEIQVLKNLTAKNNAALAQMQAQLQKAQSERVSLQLFYVVLALLLACVAALLWLLWQRWRDQPSLDTGASILTEMASSSNAQTDTSDYAGQGKRVSPGEKSAQSWWQAETIPAAAAPAANLVSGAAPVPPARPVTAPVIPATLQDLNHAFTNTRLQDVGESSFAAIAHEEVDLDLDIDMSSWAGLGDAVKSADSSAESVLDIRQQAEFFVSLGQTERAVFVLKKQIAQSGQSNPSVYLDLLSLFHSLGYKTDFREYRDAFNRHFNCVIPDFPAYQLEGRDLIAYTDELTRLSQIWSHKEVIAYLKACIYRSEQASAQPSFELAAFRDLLLLLSIAEQLLGNDEA